MLVQLCIAAVCAVVYAPPSSAHAKVGVDLLPLGAQVKTKLPVVTTSRCRAKCVHQQFCFPVCWGLTCCHRWQHQQLAKKVLHCHSLCQCHGRRSRGQHGCFPDVQIIHHPTVYNIRAHRWLSNPGNFDLTCSSNALHFWTTGTATTFNACLSNPTMTVLQGRT